MDATFTPPPTRLGPQIRQGPPTRPDGVARRVPQR